MWAHYAEKRYGLCLGFDVSDSPGVISKVEYVPDRLRDLFDRNKTLLGFDEAVVRKIGYRTGAVTRRPRHLDSPHPTR